MAARSRATWLGSGGPVRLAPSHRLYGVGAIWLDSLMIGRTTMVSGRGVAKATAQPIIDCIQRPFCFIQATPVSLTEEEIHDQVAPLHDDPLFIAGGAAVFRHFPGADAPSHSRTACPYL